MQNTDEIIRAMVARGWPEDEAAAAAKLAADVATGVAGIPGHLLADEPRLTFRIAGPPPVDGEAAC